MAYNSIISKDDAKVLTPDQQIIDEIVTGIVQGSSILPLMRRLPDATTGVASINVLDTLPVSYWVDEGVNGGLKQTTNVAWKGKKLYMEEIAVIVPIKKNVLDDASYDIFTEIKPLLTQSAYKVIDEAIILGKNKPALFREGLIPSILNAGKNVAPANLNTFTQISDAMTQVELSGYEVTAIVGGVALKGEFRKGLTDNTGQPLANSEVTELPRAYVNNGAWDNTKAKFVVGDFNQAVYSIRQDVSFEMFDTGVITDAQGNIIYNLLQQDMVALRMVMRLGWEIPNPVTALAEDETTRFPFALVEPATAPTTYNVTFTVKDDAGTPVAVTDAKVLMGEQVKKTATGGTAVFKSLGNATYTYEVSKKGYRKATGTVSVTSSAVNVAVTLPIDN